MPDGWQNINTSDKANQWIAYRLDESHFYRIRLDDSGEIIGFLFLYESEEKSELRLGYLLAESTWGKGIGTELIKGLVAWARSSGQINSISGGVEKDNIGSIKVLEKCGFSQSKEELPSGAFLYEIRFQ